MRPGGSAANLFRRIDAALRRSFPERQVYIRSRGRVQFFTIGVVLQVVGAGLTAIFLGWVAFSTVIIVFKDRIIAAQDYRYQRVQTRLEEQVAELRISYEDLNARALRGYVHADEMVDEMRRRQQNMVRSIHLPSTQDGIAEAMPAEILGRDGRAFRRNDGLLDRMFRWIKGSPVAPAVVAPHPNLGGIARDISALRTLAAGATLMMRDIGREVRRAGDEEKGLISSTGISPEQFMRRFEASESVGGPEIPIEAVHIDGISDMVFTQSLLRAEADLAQLSGLSEAVGHLPVAAPLGSGGSRTSGFGPRLDPFTGRYAFHRGVDFSGQSGTPVLATAAGHVLFAGSDGAYGNMVELDHGFGLRTRYAHLLAVAVNKGQFVPKGGMVGRLGSTGRSTGPHVHYEVWYDNVVRNPDAFIRLAKLKGVTPAHE